MKKLPSPLAAESDSQDLDAMLELAIIIDHLHTENAGTENQVVKLVRGLSTRYDINLISLRTTEWLTGASPSLPCRVTMLGMSRLLTVGFWLGLFRLWQLLRQRRPDVVHTFFPVANIFGVICARLAGVRCVASSRRDFGRWMHGGYLHATRFANRFADYVVTNAEQVKSLTARVERFAPDKIVVINNAVDIESLRVDSPDAALKASIGIPHNWKVIGLVGNFRAVKLHVTLVEAAKLLLRELDDVCLLFVGDDGDAGNQAEVMAAVDRLELRERVFVSRARGNIANHLSIIDVGVNCSESEGLSNAIIEYMAAGVPCVVSNGGGNVDLISNGQTGLVFPVRDHVALAGHLGTMLRDLEFRDRVVRAAFQKVSGEMTLPIVLDRFDRFYRAGCMTSRTGVPALH